MMYVNMIISEGQMSFETKALGETRLRAISNEMFHGTVGRAFWESAPRGTPDQVGDEACTPDPRDPR
jgi:hypothetical protein